MPNFHRPEVIGWEWQQELRTGEVIQSIVDAAKDKGCRYQIGTDMLFEQIPAYLEFFGFPTTTAEELRSVAKVAY